MGTATPHPPAALLLAAFSRYPAALAWADVLVLLSRWEGIPLSVTEAMRLGVVVCATPVGGVPEAVEHEVSGCLLDLNDPVGDCVGWLARLAEDRALLRRLSAAAAERATAWTWERAVQPLLDFIHHDENSTQDDRADQGDRSNGVAPHAGASLAPRSVRLPRRGEHATSGV